MASLDDLTNIVVVMFENRSFDNILGGLYPPGYKFGDYTFDGVTPSFTAGTTAPWTEDTSSGKPDWSDEVVTTPNPDPGERFQNMNMQLFGKTFKPGDAPTGPPPMSGFVNNYTLQKATGHIKSGGLTWPKLPRTRFWNPAMSPPHPKTAVGQDIMHGFSSLQLPVSSRLAQQYAVCDQWFASVATQTYPNRMFSLCGTSWAKKFLHEPKEYLNDWDMLILHAKTNSILEELDRQRKSDGPNWKIYYDKRCSYSISRGLLEYVHKKSEQAVDFGAEFAKDVGNGELPPFALIEPRYDAGHNLLGDNPNSYHPPYSVLEGEQLLQSIYETLLTPAANPNWKSTLLIVTFDEHGGCYDHVPPPAAPLPSADAYHDVPKNSSGPPFNRYGGRVPSILISSQITPGTIFRQTTQNKGQPTAYLDHTSIIRTVFDWLLPGDNPVSLTNRDKNAPSVSAVLTEEAGTNAGVTFDDIAWPPSITYSDAEKAALQADNHLAQMRKAAEDEGA